MAHLFEAHHRGTQWVLLVDAIVLGVAAGHRHRNVAIRYNNKPYRSWSQCELILPFVFRDSSSANFRCLIIGIYGRGHCLLCAQDAQLRRRVPWLPMVVLADSDVAAFLAVWRRMAVAQPVRSHGPLRLLWSFSIQCGFWGRQSMDADLVTFANESVGLDRLLRASTFSEN